MKRTAQDILNFVEDNDVKFVKLTFCDIFGNQKNVSLFASELPRAFEQGISFDGSSIAGFMNIEESDLILWPDPDTATVLPWRPAEGRVMRMYCDITLPNGKPFEGNCRGYLQSVVKRARAMGLTVNVGCECEFYLFETDENGNPTHIPLDHAAGQGREPAPRHLPVHRGDGPAARAQPPRERPGPERGLLPLCPGAEIRR